MKPDHDLLSFVPNLPGWSFLRLIHRGVLPSPSRRLYEPEALPLFPSLSLGARGFPHG